MALMYPRTLLASDVKSKAEAYVFEQLRDQLDDEWECFHSASWMIKHPTQGAKDGEIDFVVAHPDKGIVCLEVKGGGIECRHGEWFRIEKGQRKRMKDPFAQALDHRYDLSRKIEKVKGWRRHELLPASTVSAFPTSPSTSSSSRPTHQARSSSTARESSSLRPRSIASFDFIAARRSREATRNEGDGDAPRPAGAGCSDRGDARFPARTATARDHHPDPGPGEAAEQPRQCAATRDPRVRGIRQDDDRGGASEAASAEGKEVGFVCFNRALRDHLRERYPDSGVTFQTFHGLCVQLGHQAGIEMPDYPPGEAPQTYWDDELPEILVDAVDELGAPFDALLVDEAQDLANHWLDALRLTLRDPDNGLLWLFLDLSQEVYGSRLEVPDEFTPYDLALQLPEYEEDRARSSGRSTADPAPKPLGPEGNDVELLHTEDQPATVAAVIRATVHQRGSASPRTSSCSPHTKSENSAVARVRLGPGLTFTKDYKPPGNIVRLSSIRGFKGLESPVVILCELEDIGAETLDEQLYVGISRARNHCVVVAPPAA